MPSTDFTANCICLIDAVPSGELQTSRAIKDDIDDLSLLATDTIRCNRITCADCADLAITLKRILEQARTGGVIPIIHFDGHGNKKGLSLPSGETYPFTRLVEQLREINVAIKNNLVVLFSGCETAHALKETSILEPCPYFMLFAPDDLVRASDVDCFREFYRQLLTSGSLSEAIKAFNSKGPSSHYLTLFSQDLFARASEAYLKQHYVDDGPYEHYRQIIEKAETQLTPEQSGTVEQRIFGDQAGSLRKLFDRFMTLDVYPENLTRFQLDIDEIENVVRRLPGA